MGRHVDLDELVGAKDIASRLGVKRAQVVHEWRRRYPGFPDPVAEIGGGLIWLWPEVLEWARRTGRLSD